MKRENIKKAKELEEKLSDLEAIMNGKFFHPKNEDTYHFEFVEHYGLSPVTIKIPKECNKIIKACLMPIIEELKEQIEKLDQYKSEL